MPRFNVDDGCAVCGKPLHRGKVYCSKRCMGVGKQGHPPNNWKGGRFVSSTGYVWVYWPENAMAGKRGYVLEHRLVASFFHLGRDLTPDEVVHHIDRDRGNNDPSNLVVTTRGAHARDHLTRAWAGHG